MDQSTYLLLTRWAHAPAEREDFSDNESTYDGAEKHQVTEDPVIDDASKRKEKKKRKRKKCLDIISKVRACPKLAPSLQRHAPLVPATTPPPRSPPVAPPWVHEVKMFPFDILFFVRENQIRASQILSRKRKTESSINTSREKAKTKSHLRHVGVGSRWANNIAISCCFYVCFFELNPLV